MKTKYFLLPIVSIFLISYSLACSSSDETEKKEIKEEDKGVVVNERKIVKILSIQKRFTDTTILTYDASNNISQITQKRSDSADDIISFYIAGDAISWDRNGKRCGLANLVNGKAVNMTMKDCSFTYDSKGRLTELITKDWEQRLQLTWGGNNISKIERYSFDGNLVEKIEYSYSDYNAHMLCYFLYFNPFTESNFLDCTYEAALFFTGACGLLSQNLPSSAKFTKETQTATRTYKYQIDSAGYPVAVTIDGEGYNYNFCGYPVNIAITWD